MDILYKSTRGGEENVPASLAVLKGLCDDGGLFVPMKMPEFDFTLSELKDMDYKTTAYRVMRLLLTDYSEEELKSCIERAYDEKFDVPDAVELKKAGDQYFLELFHGKTIAFKDMALSMLPHLMTTAIKKNKADKEVVILTATSGDTGKAALEGFCDVPGTRIIVFYPKDGVSKIQKLQMVTQKGGNTKVVAVKGNFDDCQSMVKSIFNDRELSEEMAQKGFAFSSANSINIGRLVPQIVYYVYAYGRLLADGAIKEGERIVFTVPTGNFGNILAGYYAKLMGLPVSKLVCASNDNKVLYDFFETGIYDKNREFVLTCSPSMDILVSSNLERLIYMMTGCDSKKTGELMRGLSEKGRYEISEDMKAGYKDFAGFYAAEDEALDTIKKIYEKTGYVIDTHTAVAAACDHKYREQSGSRDLSVVISTASPYKFAADVLYGITGKRVPDDEDVFKVTDELYALSKTKLPPAVTGLKDAPILHDTVCEKNEMKEAVRKSLGL
ncbi:MAG: threonine synthase [Lachnospiraceae bacterium]|nr:threonine synthase [Lachnospiraceae bacterium]